MYSNNGFFDDFGGKYVAEVLRRPLDELEKAAQAMAQAMYQQQAQQGNANTSGPNNDDDVVDADFKTKD